MSRFDCAECGTSVGATDSSATMVVGRDRESATRWVTRRACHVCGRRRPRKRRNITVDDERRLRSAGATEGLIKVVRLGACNDSIRQVAPSRHWEPRRQSGHPVAQLEPQALGLFEMIDNVWEWIADYYATYSPSEVVDPKARISVTFEYCAVVRGAATKCRREQPLDVRIPRGMFTTERLQARERRRGGRSVSQGILTIGCAACQSQHPAQKFSTLVGGEIRQCVNRS
jgi:hypothetical protein